MLRNLSGAELARRADIQQPTLSKMDLGQRGVSKTFADKLAVALDVPVEALYAPVGTPLAGTGRIARQPVAPFITAPPNARFAPDAPEYPAAGLMPRDVPVFGTAQGGEDGAFELNSIGGPIDYVRRPPGLAGMRNVFAIYVEGDSMSPWREPGQFVYIHPTRPAAVGDYVVVEIPAADSADPPLAYIKQLVKRSSDEVIVRQFNPAQILSFALLPGVRVLRVIDWHEALGI